MVWKLFLRYAMNTFTTAYNSLKEYSDYAALAFSIKEETKEFTCEVRPFFERIRIIVANAINGLVKSLFGRDLGWSHLQSDQELFIKTAQHLEEYFGSRRLLQAMHSIGINTSDKTQYGLLLTKGELRDLYSELTCVTKQDFEEFISEIKNSPTPKRGTDQATWDELKSSFEQITTIQECSTEELEKLHTLLVPFPSQKEQFFSEDPFFEINNDAPHAFSQFTMRLAVAQTVERIRKKDLSRSEWEFFFTKKLAQPDFPKELVVTHPEGHLYFHEQLDLAGTHKRIFTTLGKKLLPTHVLYRGTRGCMPMDSFTDIRTTIMEDMSNEIGTYGTIQTYEKTAELFETKRDLVLLGYSLGGAYAQRDAIAFHEKVQRIVTVCSPGIDKKAAQLFADILSKQPQERVLEIVHASDEDDIVDAAGEAHLGAGCLGNSQIRLLSYAPASGAYRIKSCIPDENIISLVLRLYQVSIAHARSTSIHEHTCIEISTEDPTQQELIEKVLSHDESVYDPYIEKLRQRLSYIVVPSFTDFLKQKKPSLTQV
jgi:hypothetical protein